MPILDIQKRARELGRIRLGQKGDRGQPQKLDRFRFTGHSETLIRKVAELYGGTAQPWTPDGGTAQWEVISSSTRVPIMVPPQPVSQWYEYWTKGGCQHRCDGQTNVLTDEPCDPEDFKHREAIKKPTTRLNVVLRDVEGIGVWRVESHGFNAAIELPDVAEFLAAAGGYVNGWLALEQRTSIEQTDSGPKTRHYLVPIIEVDVTPAQLMAGHGRVAAPALAGGPVGHTPALAAAGPDYVALAAEVATVEDLTALWWQAKNAGHMTAGLDEHFARRGTELKAAASGGAATSTPPVAQQVPDAEGVYEAEVVPDPSTDDGQPTRDSGAAPEPDNQSADAVWQQIVVVAGGQGIGLADLQDHFSARMGGLSSAEASASELQAYLTILEQGAAA